MLSLDISFDCDFSRNLATASFPLPLAGDGLIPFSPIPPPSPLLDFHQNEFLLFLRCCDRTSGLDGSPSLKRLIKPAIVDPSPSADSTIANPDLLFLVFSAP